MRTIVPRFGLVLPTLCLAIGFATTNLELCHAQDRSPGTLDFEVASVHPTVFPSDAYASGFRAGAAANPCGGGKLSISGTRVSLTSAGICDIIRIAYNVKKYQVIGVPPSLGFSGQDKIEPIPPGRAIAARGPEPTFFYDIEARSPGGSPPNEDQVREMLRGLLADRFSLRVHQDQRYLSYYALLADTAGPRLKRAVEGCKVQRSVDSFGFCGYTMEQFASFLNDSADRIVVDMTGLSGKFDYEIPIDRSDARDFRALTGSVKEHLKLKLEARKDLIDVLVVDHVEGPSRN